MIWFILYFLSVGIAAVGFFGFNKYYKWVTKEKLNYKGDFLWMVVVYGILFWPLSLTLVGLTKLSIFIQENLLPD